MVALAPATAYADGGGTGRRDNIVTLNNSDSSRPMVRAASWVGFDAGNAAVTDTNIAYARSFDCTGCRTVAVAIDVVIIEGNPTTISPQNAAVAINENCHSCATFAYAHQYVLSPHHEVSFDRDTWNRLLGLRAQITTVANSGADFPTMSGQLDQLSQQAYDTVAQAIASQGTGNQQGQYGAAHADQRRQVQEQH